MQKLIVIIVILMTFTGLKTIAQSNPGKRYIEPYRPQIHFSPEEHWMNDPNGMVYLNGTWHLFYQYYPNGITWGPMHWGHAASKDLVHWSELPIALYPDSLGYIFSGSAVVDSGNTSGFGRKGRPPLVAIFTHHDPKGEKSGRNDFQNESVAYSLDEGKSWTKYADNPVLKNPGIRDFRDPKVMWFEKKKEWVMTLATFDHITFYSSPDLKIWKKESEFGKEKGAHGGVWECPDLFPLKLNAKTYWVLIANINPGGPNGGSATQYFIGEFDGNTFTPIDNKIRWLDYGPDEYAGVTWSNTGARKIFLGWMSNWQYANQVPTGKWRNAMTIPRELALVQVDGNIILTSEPVSELGTLELSPVWVDKNLPDGSKIENLPAQFVLNINMDKISDYSIILSNNSGEKLTLGYDATMKNYYIDRTESGKIDFNPQFAKKYYAPRLTVAPFSNLELVVDRSSIELFADNGLSLMTSVFFPNKPFTFLRIQYHKELTVKQLKLSPLKSIW
jgi:fructan beta-fructosidase